MFLRENRHQRVSGKTVVYLQLVESVWNRDTARAETRVVYNFGRADDDGVRDQLAALARGILRRVAPEELILGKVDWKLVESWPYGDLYVLLASATEWSTSFTSRSCAIIRSRNCDSTPCENGAFSAPKQPSTSCQRLSISAVTTACASPVWS